MTKSKNFKHSSRYAANNASQLAQQIFIRYILSLFMFAAALILLIFLGYALSHMVVWYKDNPLFMLLDWVRNNILFCAGVILFIGWVIITFRSMSKPFQYLNEIIAAAEQLAEHSDTPIRLPYALKDVENEMNLVREQGLRNAATAKEAEQRKNDLIVYLAHDLKTPLTSIIGYLTLLKDEPDISPEMRARYTGIAFDKALRLEDLVNEFFDITRFNLTTLVLEPERVNLSRMLMQITYEFNPILADKSLNWQLDIAPDVELFCDPDKLERVFDNLIRNAVNYSYPETEIQLSMIAEEDEILVRVQNQGKTIPEEKLSRIFEQFFRLDSSRSSSTGAAGLGLAIAHEIVELHHGTIIAESADESIAFTVRLPMA